MAERPGRLSAGHAHAGVLARVSEVAVSADGRRRRGPDPRDPRSCDDIQGRSVAEEERRFGGRGNRGNELDTECPSSTILQTLAPSNVQPARGTRDFLPADVRRREHVIRIVRDVYERYGFEPLETPAFENIETLLGKYGEEGNKLIFKILRRGEHEGTGEADLALRYDLTVPLARVVAQHQNDLPRFFKRYQIQPVWRADRPARGRFREFYQCDIDAIGSTSPLVEVEQLAAVSEVLIELGFQDFEIRVNHRRVLSGLLASSGILGHQHTTALVALDKLDKIGDGGVRAELTARGIQ